MDKNTIIRQTLQLKCDPGKRIFQVPSPHPNSLCNLGGSQHALQGIWRNKKIEAEARYFTGGCSTPRKAQVIQGPSQTTSQIPSGWTAVKDCTNPVCKHVHPYVRTQGLFQNRRKQPRSPLVLATYRNTATRKYEMIT